MSNNGCKLYLITPEIIEPNVFSTHLAAAIDAGNVACVQLRVKNASRDWLARTIEILRPTVHDRDVAFILNDEELCVNLLAKFNWGHTFLELNENLLKDYQKAKSEDDIHSIITEYGYNYN